jgi:hypothetical protein
MVPRGPGKLTGSRLLPHLALPSVPGSAGSIKAVFKMLTRQSDAGAAALMKSASAELSKLHEAMPFDTLESQPVTCYRFMSGNRGEYLCVSASAVRWYRGLPLPVRRNTENAAVVVIWTAFMPIDGAVAYTGSRCD